MTTYLARLLALENPGHTQGNLPTKPMKPRPEAPAGSPEGVNFQGHPRQAPTKPAIPQSPASTPTREALAGQRWGPSLTDAAPSIVVPTDWRSAVASWPHRRWSAWRRRSAELLAALDPGAGPTDRLVRVADHAAYLDIAPAPGYAAEAALGAAWGRETYRAFAGRADALAAAGWDARTAEHVAFAEAAESRRTPEVPTP